MSRGVAIVVMALLLGMATGVRAAEALPVADDAALEARVDGLASQLRCLVCQNQSLADSHAGLAIDLKNQVREQFRAGRNEAQVIDYMTQRYGDFVLYKPPWRATTALLWLGPALLALLGALLAWRTLARVRPSDVPATPAFGAAAEQAPPDWGPNVSTARELSPTLPASQATSPTTTPPPPAPAPRGASRRHARRAPARPRRRRRAAASR
jgi:cytochrome c-type biogenesis protein CcmH